MLQRSAAEFLREHPPFNRLGERALGRLVKSLRLEVHRAGADIVAQGAAPPGDLHIIRQGMVRIYARTAPDSEPVLDYRGVGETFGFLSREGEARPEVSVQAVSDTTCYVAEGAQVRRLLEEEPGLRDFLEPVYFPRRGERLPGALPLKDILHAGSEKILFTTPVQDLASRGMFTVRAEVPVREAARLMRAHRVSALVVVDASGHPAGMVTTTDLRDRVLACDGDPAAPVAGIMSAPLVAVEGREFCYEALLRMLGHDVHHLLVTEGGRPTGIVSSNDLMILQGTSPLIIVREIEGQATVEGLAVSARRVLGLVALLLREGAGAGSIIRIITNVNDRIERRILDLALRALGPPPLPWCWIVHGSAGRKEQTFTTDQDNAIVYQDPAGPAEARAAEEYFSRFAEFVVDAAQRCGFARCEGNFMATNPRWRQPLPVWERYFQGWVEPSGEDDIRNALNFFDFRGLHGEQGLAAALKEHLLRLLRGRTLFLKIVADQTREYRPPLGIFGGLRVPKGGEHPHTLDLKRHCLVPLTNAVRLFSFESGVPETSTLERIAALRAVHPTVARLGDDLAHAFEFLSLLRIRHQHEQITMDRPPDNHVNPRRLSALEQGSLRGVCRLIGHVLDEIESRYDLTRQL